jgi:purine-binding chemotaxis protein CheW
MQRREDRRLLVVRGGSRRVGLPIEAVRETMRPLPIEPLPEVPAWVLGVAIIRGEPVPVVDLGGLFGGATNRGDLRRFVTVRVEGRTVALAVEAVLDVARVSADDLDQLAPLVTHAVSEALEALALHDAALLYVLDASRIVPALPLENRQVHA